jgi:hypothetical protein
MPLTTPHFRARECDHFIVSDPSIIPQNRKAISRTAHSVPPRGTGCSAFVGNHATCPTAAHNRSARQIFDELHETIMTEFGEFGTKLGDCFYAVRFRATIERALHEDSLKTTERSVTAEAVPVGPAEWIGEGVKE